MEYNEVQSLTVNGRRYDSFADRTARSDVAQKLPRPTGGAGVGQFLAVEAVDSTGAVSAVRAVDAPNSGFGEDQLAAAVSQWMAENPDATTTVQDGAISTEKLADDAVTPEKLDGIARRDRLVPWELFYDNMNTYTSRLYPDENAAIFVLRLEKGKTYCTVADPYPAPVNKMPAPQYADNAYHGYYGAYTAPLSAEMLEGTANIPTANQISYGVDTKVLKALHTGGYCTNPTNYDLSGTYPPGYFTMLADVWIYRGALKPTDGKILESRKFYETEPGYAGPGFGCTDGGEIGKVFKFDLNAGIATDPAISPATVLMAVEAETENDRIYAAMSRDVPRDRSLRIMFIGDSITYAASNAGLQNAFRKYVSMNLNAIQNTICQSGVSVTTGSGSFDWSGATGAAYNAAVSGFAGLVAKMPRAANSFTDKIIAEGTDLVIVELGTNDFWEGAPLGSVSTLEDDTTFYGAVEKTITLLETTFPNAQILWVLPFKNARWTTANSAGCTLADYLIALKIICQMHQRVWVLDLVDKWYLNYDNESIRRKFFIDDVHITGDAHKCVAEAMIAKIRQIIAVTGLKRIEQPAWYSANDSRYGAS